MKGSSVITLNKQAIHNNITFLKREFGKKVTISSVVKANAYGHGIRHMVSLLEDEGINHFSVFDFNEAECVSQSLSKPGTVVIMGWISNESIKSAIIAGYEFYIFNIKRLKLALKYAKQLNAVAKIHLEIETGMNRTGLSFLDMIHALTLIENDKAYFEIAGFCTHLAGAESISNHVRIQKQIKNYNLAFSILQDKKIFPKYRHIANSAASIVYPETRLDLVRIGIMQYGFWSSSETFIHYVSQKKNKKNPLQRVLDWKSRIMTIKTIPVGEFVGYGISFLAQKKTKIAVIPIGYSNGYNRSLSNKGNVLISGIICQVIGVVNMNMIIADITDTNNVRIGDEVIMIGNQNGQEIKVSAFSDISNQLNYEVLSHLPKDIEREIIN